MEVGVGDPSLSQINLPFRGVAEESIINYDGGRFSPQFSADLQPTL
jgi:hypothetical protein